MLSFLLFARSPMNNQTLDYLRAMGIQPWQLKATACDSNQSQTMGAGNKHAKLMLITETPDQQGEPFVGRAGQLLDAMLDAIGLTRDNIHITQISKSSAPLAQEIALIQPPLLLAVGQVAAHSLLHTDAALDSLRNKIHLYGELNTPLIITYHPAYLLKNQSDKIKAFQDLQLTHQTLRAVDSCLSS